VFRAKLAHTARDGTSAILASQYGITPKAVRDIWNLRTWATATRPLWSQEDLELWERKTGRPPPPLQPPKPVLPQSPGGLAAVGQEQNRVGSACPEHGHLLHGSLAAGDGASYHLHAGQAQLAAPMFAREDSRVAYLQTSMGMGMHGQWRAPQQFASQAPQWESSGEVLLRQEQFAEGLGWNGHGWPVGCSHEAPAMLFEASTGGPDARRLGTADIVGAGLSSANFTHQSTHIEVGVDQAQRLCHIGARDRRKDKLRSSYTRGLWAGCSNPDASMPSYDPSHEFFVYGVRETSANHHSNGAAAYSIDDAARGARLPGASTSLPQNSCANGPQEGITIFEFSPPHGAVGHPPLRLGGNRIPNEDDFPTGPWHQNPVFRSSVESDDGMARLTRTLQISDPQKDGFGADTVTASGFDYGARNGGDTEVAHLEYGDGVYQDICFDLDKGPSDSGK